MTETRKANEDTRHDAEKDQSVQDLEPEALSPSQEVKVTGGLRSVREGFTEN